VIQTQAAGVPDPHPALHSARVHHARSEPLRPAAVDAANAILSSDNPGDIPLRALSAYQLAAATLQQAAPDCRLDWSLLAAIGKVESDHGRSGGAQLGADGVSHPLIRGVALDGHGGVAKVADTDGGRLDGDPVWDRAVGPMQILPSTWSYIAVDGDGDGQTNPDDIDDAALAAAVYLCAAPGNLGNPQGAERAVFSYNPSNTYVHAVLWLAHSYSKQYGDGGAAILAEGPIRTITPGSAPATADGRTGSGTRSPSGHQDTSTNPAGDQPSTAPSDQPSPHRSPGGDPKPAPSPSDTQTPDPTPTPSDTPTPTETPTPDPTDSPGPGLTELTGVLTQDDTGFWYVGDVPLDVGDDTWLATTAIADFDLDGTVETNADELTGLIDTEVVVDVTDGTDPVQLVTINDASYLPTESPSPTP
jgi:hypothetical protein